MEIHETRALLAQAEAALAQARAVVAYLHRLLDEDEADLAIARQRQKEVDDEPLSPEEHARLNEMIAAGMADVAAGRVVDGPTFMANMKTRIAARRLTSA